MFTILLPNCFIACSKASSSPSSPLTVTHYSRATSPSLSRITNFSQPNRTSSESTEFDPLSATSSTSDRSGARETDNYTRDRHRATSSGKQGQIYASSATSTFYGKDVPTPISHLNVQVSSGNERVQYN